VFICHTELLKKLCYHLMLNFIWLNRLLRRSQLGIEGFSKRLSSEPDVTETEISLQPIQRSRKMELHWSQTALLLRPYEVFPTQCLTPPAYRSAAQQHELRGLDVRLSNPFLSAPALGGFCGIRRRDCLSAASSSGSPAKPAQRGLPAALLRVADSGVAFLLLTFLWRSKEK